MQPGGTDVVILTQRPVELMEFAVRWLFSQWKQALACDANGGEKWFPQTFFNIPFGEHEELFVFPSKKDFDVSGDQPDRVNYIHLLREEDALTVVMPIDSREGAELAEVLKNTKFPGVV
jgi:hypothetical protein